MPEIRVTDEKGITHVFPDGSTPEMIAKAMGVQVGGTPAPQAQQPQPQAEVPWYEKTLDSLRESFGIPNSNPLTAIPQEIGSAVRNPLDAAKQIVVDPLVGMVRAQGQELQTGIDQIKNGEVSSGAAHALYSLIPILGPNMGKAGEQLKAGDYSRATGTLLGTGAQAALMTPKGQAAVRNTISAVKETPSKLSPRGMFADKMQEVPAGERFSRQEVLDAARANNVNLDLADATGSGAANAVKKANSVSIASKGVIERNSQNNLVALEKWADTELGKYAPESTAREVLGGQAQAALNEDLTMRKAAASTQFADLDKRIGPNAVDVAPTVQGEARKIINENKSYYEDHPELMPKQAWSILEDLASNKSEAVPTWKEFSAENMGRAMKENGGHGPAMKALSAEYEQLKSKAMDAPASKSMSWQELHQLRSDLMDFYRNNPDVVKGRGESWIQRMVGTIDNAMTDASAGLSPADLEQFRHANQLWEGIKQTYDNPQSPLYHAVRSQFPSQVPGMLSKSTPELARQVRTTLGSLEGPFQRQFVENLVNNKEGVMDLRGLNSRLKRVPDDVLESMIGKDNAKNLRMLGKVSEKVTADANPSGTAKTMVPAGEIGGFLSNPALGATELGASYLSAKVMTSPKWIDYLTKTPTKDAMRLRPGSLTKPWWAAPAVAASAQRERKR